MSRAILRKLGLVFGLLAGLALACQGPLALPLPLQPTPDPQEAAWMMGTGSSDLPDPSAGLAALPGYRAELRRHFSGLQAGQASQWSDHFSLSVSHLPPARLLTVETSGLEDSEEHAGRLVGEAQGVSYYRAGTGSGCQAFTPSSEAPGLPIPELASFLTPVSGMEDLGMVETVNDLPVKHYRFDERSLGLEGVARASGEVWVATEGAFVVKYVLRLEGDGQIFDEASAGSALWEYELRPLEPDQAVELPDDCPLGLAQLPVMETASEITRLPGFLSYTTPADLHAVVAFYRGALPSMGWHASGEGVIGPEFSGLRYTRGEQQLTLQVLPGDQTQVEALIEPIPGETRDPEAQADSGLASDAEQITERILMALPKTLGSAFTSYTMEARMDRPAWQAAQGEVANQVLEIQAAVQGLDLHLVESLSRQNEPPQARESYRIAGQEYRREGERLVAHPGATAGWQTWPSGLDYLLGVAVLGAQPESSQGWSGRPADVYSLDSARAAPQALQAVLAITPEPLTRVTGRIWVDRATGGLLHLTLAYEAAFQASACPPAGCPGRGAVEISLAQINQAGRE